MWKHKEIIKNYKRHYKYRKWGENIIKLYSKTTLAIHNNFLWKLRKWKNSRNGKKCKIFFLKNHEEIFECQHGSWRQMTFVE